MIKHVDKDGTIDLKALEIGDQFLVLRHMPFLSNPFIHVTVLNLSEKKINAIDTDGKKYNFNRFSDALRCYSINSRFVEKEKIAMKIRDFFEELSCGGPESVDKELLNDLEAWKERQKTKRLQKPERTDRD